MNCFVRKRLSYYHKARHLFSHQDGWRRGTLEGVLSYYYNIELQMTLARTKWYRISWTLNTKTYPLLKNKNSHSVFFLSHSNEKEDSYKIMITSTPGCVEHQVLLKVVKFCNNSFSVCAKVSVQWTNLIGVSYFYLNVFEEKVQELKKNIIIM